MRLCALMLCALAASTLDWSAPAHAAAKAAAASQFAPSRFSVVVEGKGPHVIFIPGLSSTRDVWAASVQALKSKYRLHLVQLKGFGEEAGPNASGPVLKPFVEELAAYIEANKLKSPAIVGHSMGGLAALMLAAEHPRAAGKLMIVDAFPFIGPVFGAPDVATITPRAEQMRSMVLAQAAKVTPAFGKPADCPATLPAPARIVGNMTNSAVGACIMKHGATASDMRVVAQAMYDDMLTDMRPRLKDIAVPVTMLYPQDDRLVTKEEADKLYAESYAGTPKLKLVRIPGSYHFIMQDQPALFEEQLKAFLR
ncbi:MAG TPA: alpha/beta hydrolase [Sphingomicrobium sp.]|jgi:pimeloyl-ACP methyl ester carboxylesterase